MDGDAAVAIVVADGEPLAFPSLGAALARAAALQPGRRVGVDSAPEAEARAVAAGLSDRAEPGQILVSDRVRWGARDGRAFRDAGPLAPGRKRDDEPVWELLWGEPAPRSRIRLCGEPLLEIDGERRTHGGGQAAALLAFLLASPQRSGGPRRADRRAVARSTPRDPQAALRPLLSRLRRAIAPAELEGRDRLRLALPEPVWTDVGEATAALAAARAAAKAAHWAAARRHAEAARALLQAGYLPGRDEEWVRRAPARGRGARARGAGVGRARLARPRR